VESNGKEGIREILRGESFRKRIDGSEFAGRGPDEGEPARRRFILANLRGANLVEADLRETNLLGTEFSGANMMGANLYGAQGLWAGRLGGTNLFDATCRKQSVRMTAARRSGSSRRQRGDLSFADYDCVQRARWWR